MHSASMNSYADRISPSIPLQQLNVCKTSAKPGQPATGHSIQAHTSPRPGPDPPRSLTRLPREWEKHCPGKHPLLSPQVHYGHQRLRHTALAGQCPRCLGRQWEVRRDWGWLHKGPETGPPLNGFIAFLPQAVLRFPLVLITHSRHTY